MIQAPHSGAWWEDKRQQTESFRLDIKKNSQALNGISQRGCVVSILQHFQDQTATQSMLQLTVL